LNAAARPTDAGTRLCAMSASPAQDATPDGICSAPRGVKWRRGFFRSARTNSRRRSNASAIADTELILSVRPVRTLLTTGCARPLRLASPACVNPSSSLRALNACLRAVMRYNLNGSRGRLRAAPALPARATWRALVCVSDISILQVARARACWLQSSGFP
jgi:hypothetical protein